MKPVSFCCLLKTRLELRGFNLHTVTSVWEVLSAASLTLKKKLGELKDFFFVVVVVEETSLVFLWSHWTGQ